jgi:hypothetical protein
LVLETENGSIEGPRVHLKRTLQQAFLMRGSCDFASLHDYRRFVDEIVGRANVPGRKALEVERAQVKALPPPRTCEYEGELVTVTRSSGFLLPRVFYTVQSRLIGHRLPVRLYDDRLDCLLSGILVLTLARGRRPTGEQHARSAHVVDHHHVIRALGRKPMALLSPVYRDELFPRVTFCSPVWRSVAAGNR